MKKKIGVYVCHCGTNIAGYMDVAKLTDFARTLDEVAVARHYHFMCSDPGQDMIKKDIRELGLNGVLVCSCSPNMHLRTFREACQDAGLNPFQCEMATIRELSAWVHSHDQKAATETAMRLLADGVRRVAYRNPLKIDFAPVNPVTLVVGGGIAGIQTALEIARSEHKVYLVEKEPSIGGHMAQLNVTFPRLESAVDMLSERMKMVKNSKYIELLTYSEVTEVSGYIGNFQVSIKKKTRSVNPVNCDGCGACITACPEETVNEFDMGLSNRKAIYMQYPEAVPHIPVIDRFTCLRYKGNECSRCKDACPKNAIDYETNDEIVTIECGNIIVATGYDVFSPVKMERYGYRKFDNVITSMEFERLASPSGPTGGKITLKDGSVPKSVAIVHCVGSRDQNYHEYCSRICCTYGLKDAHLIRGKTGADVYQMYIDMRCFGKGHEEFYKKASEANVHFIRGKVAEVTDITLPDEEKGKLIIVCEDTLLGDVIRVPVDMVILNTAMEPRKDIDEVARTFLLTRSRDGFFLERHPKLDPVGTMLDGIYSVGCCQGPKDIVDTVSQATGAAARALALISRGSVQMEAATAFVDAEVCSGCGYCEEICAYSAVEVDPGLHIAVVNGAVCKGCGACAVNCPSKAIQLKNFDPKQIMDVIDTATEEYAGLAG